MAWKKKEEEIAPDIAVEKAHEALDRYWLRTPALFWVVNSNEGAPQALQLHELKIIPGTGNELTKRIPELPKVLKGSWVLVVVDPIDVRTSGVIKTLKEWRRRYERHQVHFFLVLKSKLSRFQTPAGMTAFDEDYEWEGILATDYDLKLSQAFAISQTPAVQIWNETKCEFKSEGSGWSKDVEKSIHKLLRKNDPGIPMLPPISETKIPVISAQNGIYFGSAFKESPLNRAPWQPVYQEVTEDGEKVEKILHYSADFGSNGWLVPFQSASKKSGDNSEIKNEMKLLIKGKWILKEFGIFTTDASAEISWEATHANVSIMVGKATEIELPARVAMEISKRTPLAQFCSSEARIDDEGHLVLDVRREAFRLAFNNLSKRPGERNVSLHFTQAAKIGVALYYLVEWE